MIPTFPPNFAREGLFEIGTMLARFLVRFFYFSKF